jgi:hypothetical protein
MWPHHGDLQHLAIILMQEDFRDFVKEKKQQIREWKEEKKKKKTNKE